jgi:hypothetical protein
MASATCLLVEPSWQRLWMMLASPCLNARCGQAPWGSRSRSGATRTSPGIHYAGLIAPCRIAADPDLRQAVSAGLLGQPNDEDGANLEPGHEDD